MEKNDISGKEDKARTVLVTGASGFIGGHVTRYFVERGYQVICQVRMDSDLSYISDLPVNMVVADILDKERIREVSRGVGLIIHTAGKADDWGSYRDFYNVNVIGTMNVLEAAVYHGISKVIVTGTISSYGEDNCTSPRSEESPYNSHYRYAFNRIFPCGMNHYRDSKALMTRRSVEFALQHGLDLIILEPVWVYGENEFSSGFYDYLRSVGSGVHFMPGSRKNSFHVVHARDLARAYWLAAHSGLKGTHRFIIGNKTTDNHARIMELFCTAAGYRFPTLLPKPASYTAGFVMELVYTLLRSRKPPLLTRARVNMFYDSLDFKTSKAAEMLGFEQQVPLEDGIRETVQWYRKHNYLQV